MAEFWRELVLGAATVTTGLMAGLFFAFTVAVMPGLRRVDHRTFVYTMQRINAAILNPVFLAVYLGAFLLTALSVVLHLGRDQRGALLWIVAALLLYGAVVIITARVNVPLNNQLARVGDPDEAADLAATRRRFEGGWVPPNTLRTVLNTAALICLVLALTR